MKYRALLLSSTRTVCVFAVLLCQSSVFAFDVNQGAESPDENGSIVKRNKPQSVSERRSVGYPAVHEAPLSLLPILFPPLKPAAQAVTEAPKPSIEKQQAVQLPPIQFKPLPPARTVAAIPLPADAPKPTPIARAASAPVPSGVAKQESPELLITTDSDKHIVPATRMHPDLSALTPVKADPQTPKKSPSVNTVPGNANIEILSAAQASQTVPMPALPDPERKNRPIPVVVFNPLKEAPVQTALPTKSSPALPTSDIVAQPLPAVAPVAAEKAMTSHEVKRSERKPVNRDMVRPVPAAPAATAPIAAPPDLSTLAPLPENVPVIKESAPIAGKASAKNAAEIKTESPALKTSGAAAKPAVQEIEKKSGLPASFETTDALSRSSKSILSSIPSHIDAQKSGGAANVGVARVSPAVDALDIAKSKADVDAYQAAGIKISVRRPGLDTNYELNRAFNALTSGDSSTAMQVYKDVLSAQPTNADALFGLASIYHRQGQIDKARPLYGVLLKNHPNHREGINNFLVLVSEESPKEALAELERLEQRNTDFSPIPAQQALVLEKLGHTAQAQAKMQRAIELAPENMTYKYNLAVMCDRQGNYTQASELYRLLIESAHRGETIPAATDTLQKRLNYVSTLPNSHKPQPL